MYCQAATKQSRSERKTKTLAVQHTLYDRPMSSIEAAFELHCTCSTSPLARNPQLQEMTGGTCTRWAEYQTMLIPMKTRTQSFFCERDDQASRRSECQTIEPATKQNEITEYNQLPMTIDYKRKQITLSLSLRHFLTVIHTAPARHCSETAGDSTPSTSYSHREEITFDRDHAARCRTMTYNVTNKIL